VERHDAELVAVLPVSQLTERKEAADERPVRMDAATAGIEKDTAPVRFVAKDGSPFFRVCPVELGCGDLKGPGQTKGLIRADPDRFVGAANAANLAFERKRAVLFQVENESGGRPGLVHFSLERSRIV